MLDKNKQNFKNIDLVKYFAFFTEASSNKNQKSTQQLIQTN